MASYSIGNFGLFAYINSWNCEKVIETELKVHCQIKSSERQKSIWCAEFWRKSINTSVYDSNIEEYNLLQNNND